MERALVVGAGIAGLAVARALTRNGVACEVIERAAHWDNPGLGMYLPANAVRAVDRLGLGEPVRDRAREIRRQRFLDHRGRLLLDVDLRRFWGAVGPCLAIERRHLRDALRDDVVVRMSTTGAAVREEGLRVRTEFADGTVGEYDMVVGADGVHSWTRAAALGGSEPRLVGQASWRFLVDGFPEITAWTVWLGRGRALLTVPLGGGRVYCYADLDAAAPTDPVQGSADALCELFRDFAAPVRAVLEARRAAEEPAYFSAIEEVVQEPWVRGRVALVGDAAHAMSPNMAEGAGLALEDALVLADVVAEGSRLESFEDRRRSRVAFVRAQTHRRDRTRGLPATVRNAALRYVGQRIFRANYGPLRISG